MKYYISFLVLLSLLTSCTQIKTKSITKVSQNEFNDVILIDVRSPDEFAAGHIKNARNINWFDADFAKQMSTIDKKETIYLYCKKGGRSAKAAALLDSLGYQKVVNLEGGYDAFIQK